MYNTNIESVEPPLLEEYKKVPLKTNNTQPKSVKLEQFHASILNKKAEEAERQRLEETKKASERPPTAPRLTAPTNGALFDNYGRSYEKYTSTFTVKAAGVNTPGKTGENNQDALHNPILVTNPASDMGTKIVFSDYADKGDSLPEFVQHQIKVDAHEELLDKPISVPRLKISTEELVFKDLKAAFMQQGPSKEDAGTDVINTNLGTKPKVSDIGIDLLPIVGLNIHPEVSDIGQDIKPITGLNTDTIVSDIGTEIKNASGINLEPEVNNIGDEIKTIVGLNQETEVSDIGDQVQTVVGMGLTSAVSDIGDEMKSVTGLNQTPKVTSIGSDIQFAIGLNTEPEVTGIRDVKKSTTYKRTDKSLATYEKYYENFVSLSNISAKDILKIETPAYKFLSKYADFQLPTYQHFNDGDIKPQFIGKSANTYITAFPETCVTMPAADYTSLKDFYRLQEVIELSYLGENNGDLRAEYVYAQQASTELTKPVYGTNNNIDTGISQYYSNQESTDYTFYRDLDDTTGVLTHVPEGDATNTFLTADHESRYNESGQNYDSSYNWTKHRDSGTFVHHGYHGGSIFSQDGVSRATKYGTESSIQSSVKTDNTGNTTIDSHMNTWYPGRTIEKYNLTPHKEFKEQKLTSPTSLKTNLDTFYAEKGLKNPEWRDPEDIRRTKHAVSVGTIVSGWITGENKKDAAKGLDNPVYTKLTEYDEQALGQGGFYDATGWGEFYCTNISSQAREFLEITGSMLGNITQTIVDPINYGFPFKKLWEPITSTALYQAYRLIPWDLVFMPRGNNPYLILTSPLLGKYVQGKNFKEPGYTSTRPGISCSRIPSVKFEGREDFTRFANTYGKNHTFTPTLQGFDITSADDDYQQFWDHPYPQETRAAGLIDSKTHDAILNDMYGYEQGTEKTLFDSYKSKTDRFKAYKSIQGLKASSSEEDESSFGTAVNFGTEFYWDILFDYPKDNKQYLPEMPYKGWIPVKSFNIMGTQMGTTSVETIAGHISIPDSYQLPSSIQITLPETSRYDVDTWMRAYFSAIFTPFKGSSTETMPSLHILPYKNQTMYITIYWLTEQWMPIREKTFICIPDFKFQYMGSGDKALHEQEILFNIVGTHGFSSVTYRNAKGDPKKNIQVLE